MKEQGGYTLLELLVGLVILGFLLAGLGAGLRYEVRAGAVQAQLINRSGDLDAVERALRRVVAEADPGGQQGVPLQGAPDQVAFTTTLPRGTAAATGQADVSLMVDGGHRLVLWWAPHRYGRPFAAPGPAQEIELLHGVDHVELAYWSAGWRRTGTNPDLPTLIRLRVVFPPGDVRHWPDMLMATASQRPP